MQCICKTLPWGRGEITGVSGDVREESSENWWNALPPALTTAKAWFSLAHKHKHKDIRTRRMAHLSQFSIPALLNPMINKMSEEASAILLLICSHEVWVKLIYDWFTACAYVCAYVDPNFISQSYDTSISTTTRRTNLSVFLSSGYAYAYVDPVFTWLYMCLCLCFCLRASQNQA